MTANQWPDHAVAIVALAARVPGADDVNAFWADALAGRERISRFAEHELEDAFSAEDRAQSNYVPARSILEGVELFDAGFFGMQPREAALTDPQHRVFLELAWEALERANIDPSRCKAPIGVFAGASMPTYLLAHVLGAGGALQRFASDYQVGSYPELLGALPDALATRVAYKFGLTGPAMTVQTACSTSLVAVVQACQSLLMGQCDVALAGGVSITFPQKRGYLHLEGAIASADGRCRPFDASASGTVFGSGAGVVALKRLEDALASGDRIHAVIRGFGLNNDGAAKAGFTAPSVTGQADAIAMALGMAGLDADAIGYVEAHGTGTPLGDPIEFEGLLRAFAGATPAGCALGSAKANVGHLDAAAGVVGLIRAALAVERGVTPPLAGFETANPRLDLEASPFFVPVSPSPWRKPGPRRAGVSSFGVGGTNAHVVIEQAPAPATARAQPEPGVEVLPLSAKTPEALAEVAQRLAQRLEAEPEMSLGAVAATLKARTGFSCRTAVAAASPQEAIEALKSGPRLERANPRGAVFLFPGQGAQYAQMARGLYDQDPAFRRWIDHGAAVLEPLLGLDIRNPLYRSGAQDVALRDTGLAQPALYLVEYALAQALIGAGVAPAAMVGHSVGEFVCAALAGVFSFEDGLRLIAARARLMRDQPGGGMLSVRLSAERLSASLPSDLDLAAVNGPELCVVAGSVEAIERYASRLEADGVAVRRLHTSHAFHSRMMDAIVAPLEVEAAKIALRAPSIPYASCVTGAMITPTLATDPAYWARHARAPVKFAEALLAAATAEAAYVEVGPGRALSSLCAQILPKGAALVQTLPDHERDTPDALAFGRAVGRLWSLGALPDWPESDAPKAELPTYPFQRTRCWIDPAQRQAPAAQATTATPALAATSAPAVPDRQQPEQPPMIAASPAAAGSLLPEILALIAEVAGRAFAPEDGDVNFLELGFDSLALGQVAQKLKAVYGVKITFRQLMGELPTPAALAARLSESVPQRAAKAPAVPLPAAAGPAVASSELPDLAQIAAQLATLQAQVDVLRNARSAPGAAAKPARAHVALPAMEEVNPRFRGAPRDTQGALSDAQKSFVAEFSRSFAARTAGSKAYTARHRAHLADPRAAAGFRQEWKEIVYPIVARRSQGSKIWDVDGNEYVDLVNGYGQTAFGHAPDFVVEAVKTQLEEGFAIGPQSPLAGEVAELISKMTGMPRVTFCNTGSEAVMAAMRVARAVTGRSEVVVFANDYHGQFDEVLVKSGRDGRAAAFAPGIPPEAVSNMAVLPYGREESLAWIEAHAEDIAAVIVEPVQSRHPALRPVEFLQSLRALTQRAEIALVFDEVVTGFRVHPGGAQALFGIRADMATYGKVLGGGMPIGVLAGAPEYMDALDGGTWNYGDESFPEVAPTFFAGTFVRHPTALAAAKAVLLHLEREGPELQRRLDATMAGLVARIAEVFSRRGLEIAPESFSSWFYLALGGADRLGGLFYPLVRSYGVNVQEGYPCFLTTAHDAADLDRVVFAFERALDDLQAIGAFAPTKSVAGGAVRVPLTEPQREIWLAAQTSEAASCAFNEGLTLRLRGPLHAEALTSALDAVLARHDALRMRFAPTGEWQQAAAPHPWPLERRDLEGADAEQRLADLMAQEAARPFDLVDGPPVRATLARLAHFQQKCSRGFVSENAQTQTLSASNPTKSGSDFVDDALGAQEHALVLCAHHIVCDGWSYNVIVEELAQLYSEQVGGRAASLPAPLDFSTYAVREAGKAIPERTVRFWKEVYADVPEPVDVPGDRPRSATKRFAGATRTVSFDRELRDRAARAAAGQGASLFAMLLASLQVVLGRISEARDVVVATPTAGQAALDDETLVGHAVNFLALRTSFDPHAPFAAHLAAVKAHALAAFDHAEMTFGALVRTLGVKRDPSRLPLTNVQFNLEKIGAGAQFEGLQVELAPGPKRFVNFDLFFNVVDSDSGLRIDVDYSCELYDAPTIDRLVGIWREALSAASANPHTPIAALPLASLDEQRRLAAELRGPQRAIANVFAHQLIGAQVARTPQAAAVTAEGRSLTYAELDARAAEIAARIAAVCAPGDRVAVALDRSVDLPAALLAVWKAGCAYVPLDPGHPAERLRKTMHLARVSALVCASGALVKLAPEGAATVRVDRLEEAATAALPKQGGDPATAAAYIIFTSGSTGDPKGVEVSHRALVNFLTSMAERPGLQAQDRLLSVTTVSFDIAGLEIFGPLSVGAQTILASRDAVQSGFGAVALIAEVGATVVQATPSLWRILLEAGYTPRPGVRMLCGGEPLPRDLADRLLQGGGDLWNMYGPTETTVWSTCGRVDASGAIHVGEAIANTDLFVLDAVADVPAPVGVPGRLFIGGAGLANGYFDRQDLTAAAFRTLSTPLGALRLYDTGDRAVVRGDGKLELLGRADQQIKLRGFRIELEEIEAALRAQPGVAACAVALRDGADGAPRLVGYIVGATAPDSAALAAGLARTLPDYMIPTTWVRLEQLPLTAAGKLDRKSLPAPGSADEQTRDRGEAPREGLESEIAAVWREVLGLTHVGREETLFSLGADSLHLFRIAARLVREGHPTTVKDILAAPTVAQLAAALADGRTGARVSGPSLKDFLGGARRRG